jgi:dienelactone hydrolase
MRAENNVICTIVGIGLMFLTVVPVVAQNEDGGYQVFRPDGPGPHPAVVFLSGCSGLKPSFAPKAYEQAAERLRAIGFIVVWADYIGRRNISSCFGGVTPEEAAGDAVAAAAWLRSQNEVDARRITVMGWSWGGGAVLLALDSYSVEELIFTRAIVYYPYCTSKKPWTHRVPVLVLQGDADNMAPPEMCKSVLETSAQKGDVKVITYPGAKHCFDMSENYGYHPQAAVAAWEDVQRFLKPTK